MNHFELTNKECNFKIYLANIARIRKEDVDRISEAWAVDYYIYLRVGGEGKNLYLEIFSTRIPCTYAIDIKKDWHKYATLLRENPPRIPFDWINYVKNTKGGF